MEEMAKETETKKSCWEGFRSWLGSPSFYIYVNFFLGSWGDRMWWFSVGLYLVVLSKGLLRLAAIFGLCGGISVLLLGGLLGDWVDRNPRLKVVRISLFVQNFSVMLSAIAVCLTLYYEEIVNTYWDGGLKMLSEAAIITLAIIAQLASVAYKIAVQKDWIVVISKGNKSALANLNAVMRATDLSCKVLAPTTAGFIMSYASLVVSAMTLAGWNLVSVFIEYALLRKVFNMVPELAVKKGVNDAAVSEKQPENGIHEKEKLTESYNKEILKEKNKSESMEEVPLQEDLNKEDEPKDVEPSPSKPKKKKKSLIETIFDPFITLGRSWKTYVKQKVVFAGLSLSFLFMTVLGFDSITVGFIYTNGVKELFAGISMALAGVTGIIGTFIYTRLRKRIGLERTGLFAYAIDIMCLSLCVASVFTPGSPFDPYYKPGQNMCNDEDATTVSPPLVNVTNFSTHVNASHNLVKRDIIDLYSQLSEGPFFTTLEGYTIMEIDAPNAQSILPSSFHFMNFTESNQGDSNEYNMKVNPDLFNNYGNRNYEISEKYLEYHVISKRDIYQVNDTGGNKNETNCRQKWKHEGLNISVILLLIGIVISRVGLWMADLVVTQLLQENVPENERGAVGGVQNSLNMLMDLLKFIVVIFVPHIETFGYLILMSYTFICIAGCLFAFHSYRVRGHLFHCRAFWCFCCKRGGNVPIENGKHDPKLKQEEKITEMKDMKALHTEDDNVV